jgi:hypothetical protein
MIVATLVTEFSLLKNGAWVGKNGAWVGRILFPAPWTAF